MTRLILTCTALTLALSGPAAAFSFSLPLLTYPAPSTPDVTQSCVSVTEQVVETCTAPAK
ncbi:MULTISPECIES: hypothetical protein [unclassified Yoonia]|uniref:hypothetical protein n=1 Tax=unclassified Yoonia TaxID=2629118 RepID=UPI002B000F17|nr:MULTISPECIES: hypothetical protein [unclassified Yoonia]